MGLTCIINSSGACSLCKSKKQRCSLMPRNLETRKTLCSMNSDELLEFCLEQAGVQQAMEVKKGKQHAVNPPDAGEAEGSGQSPSPLTALSGHNTLLLDSPNRSPAATTLKVPPPPSSCLCLSRLLQLLPLPPSMVTAVPPNCQQVSML